ncbi:MAG: SDR family oxidoreductase [Hyphomicrobiales bacterium]|nr:MAG: SDR family oxidoreductase [Hyphomicrobiales bacterium]
MNGRVQGKVAIVVGGGQTPGADVGNGRATAVVLAREGAKVLVADRDLASAQDTVEQILAAGGEAFALRVDVTQEDDILAMTRTCTDMWERIDILHNNVGVSHLGGDAQLTDVTAEGFNRIVTINLQGMVLACKHAVSVMRKQGRGVITNISSNAVLIDYPYIGYQTSKAGVLALTRHVAIRNAGYGIRANSILPGLMNTPMAVEHRVSQSSATRDEVIEQRNARVPLSGPGGTAWDIANAALFLASDDAAFITGAELMIDGGQSLAVQ